MEELIIAIVSLLASALTFFSGFGLGTILMPVFAVFFPVDLAIALTAIVHFLNNIFKFLLTGKHVDKEILLKFGIPSILAALIGALLLNYLSHLQPLFSWSYSGKLFDITPIKLIICLALIFFALFDIVPKLKNMQFARKYLPLGGLISGFFGGLSGHQGALRSVFLIRAGLSKETFIATGIAIACFIDITRLSVYAANIMAVKDSIDWKLIIIATLSAFAGAFIGNLVLKKVTIETVQLFVAFALIVFAVFLGLGII